jgi:periplasmic divalent cation tolerance protein
MRCMSTAETAPDETRVVLITAPDRATGEKLARELVGRRLAACVNLLDGVTSIYRWEGAIEAASEVLLMAKTTAGRYAELERALAELHPYQVPECIALAPTSVAPRYRAWLMGCVS